MSARTTDLMDALMILVRGQIRVPEMVVDDATYWQLLVDAHPEIRSGATLGELTCVADLDGTLHQYVVPAPWKEAFELAAPHGPVLIRRMK